MACKISREPYIMFSYLDSVGFLRCFFGKILPYMSPVVTGDNNGKSFEKKKKSFIGNQSVQSFDIFDILYSFGHAVRLLLGTASVRASVPACVPPFPLSNMNISKDTRAIFKFYLNKNKNGDLLRAASISKRMKMGHTAVSTTEASSMATWSQNELLKFSKVIIIEIAKWLHLV